MQRSWDSRIEADDRTNVVAIYGRKPLAEWAIERKVRMLFLGGGTGGLPVSLVRVKTSHMAAEGFEKLTALGHTRIVIPLCDRTETFNCGIRDAAKNAIEAAGGVFVESYHCAVLCWSGAALRLKDRDEWIAWDPLTRGSRLPLVTQLRRFLVLESRREPSPR